FVTSYCEDGGISSPLSIVETQKDKIEEAQKELKEPKGSQKGISESSRRNADNIKGLKRKKVVAENQLKKIPKSPVKKPLQSKASETVLHGASSKETTPSCSSSSNSPSHNPSTSPGGVRDQHDAPPVAASPGEGSSSADAERLKEEETSQRAPSLETTDFEEGSLIAAEVSQAKDVKSEEPSFEGDPYHSSAPLDVLLKAMEPDFSSLAERNNALQVTAIGKPASSLHAQCSGELNTMPAVNVGLQNQTSHMQTYYIDKQGNVIGIAAPLQRNVQTSTQGIPMQSSPLVSSQFMHVSSNPEKPALHMSFNSGPSTITHAPVPSGSNALPQSQPPVVHTCQSITASVPSTIQVPVTPCSNHVQMATVMNYGAEQVSKDQKAKKPGKYVCEYCSRACAKPSVLLKHIRSHTGERPYPCVTCGFSFKTKSNLYKHKKSHAHAIKLGLIARSESGGGSLSQESDKALGTHSDPEESGDSDEEGSTADLDPDSSQGFVAALSETSLQNAGTNQASQGEVDSPGVFDSVKPAHGQRAHEPKVTAALPKVVVYPVNVSPLRADSPRVTGAAPEQAAAQRQRDFQTANLRSSITVLSSLKEVDGANPSLDTVSEDEDQQCKSPLLGGHAQLQRQQATDFSQQQQAKCLLSPRSLGSTDSGYFSRSESADQAMSPPSPFVKITPPVDIDIAKNILPNIPPVAATVMHVAAEQKPRATVGQMRPPLEAKALSLEERISKLISDNEAVVDNKQLDSVKPRRTSLSRRVRQAAVEDFTTSEGHGLPTVRSMDDGYHGQSSSAEVMPRSRSFEHNQDRNRKPLQNKGTMYECETCRNRYRKPNSFETESIDRASPVDIMEKDPLNKPKPDAIANVSADGYHEETSKPKSTDYGKQMKEQCTDCTGAPGSENTTPVHQSRLVRQNNIQVPEIFVTEEPDREHETQISEPADKPAEQFNWPQRSESLSKLPAEKLPPKKKRIRLAQMEQSSGESSFESSLSRSLSRDSSLSRCSSITASFDRDETSRSESPSRGECVGKVPEPQGLPTAFNTLGVPGMMRRAVSEQITCTQPSVEISCDYRSKSFDCGNVSPSRSLSPVGQPRGGNISHVSQVNRKETRFDQSQAGAIPLPQILITHEQMHPAPSLSSKTSLSSTYSVDSDTHAVPTAKKDRIQTETVNTHNHIGERAPSLGSLHCTQKLASVTLCPQQEPTASSKRMLSPANSLDIYMEKHQKRAKDEHGVACLTDGRSVNYLNSKMSEVTRQRKFTLVRQVCTTEPVDSPIETEAPPLPQVKTDGVKDSEATDDVKPMSPDSTGLDKDTSTVIHEAVAAVNATPGSQVICTPANDALRPQEKAEDQRWTPAKSPIKPSSFHGSQVKLTTSVSVVNTKDSHRLSFPSLKTATTFTWCFLMKRKPLHVQQTDLKTSAYAAWTVSPNNPNPLGLPTKVVMSLFDSKQTPRKYTTPRP
ncbi:unnamed protein product, partial [Pleuronectes platessa]